MSDVLQENILAVMYKTANADKKREKKFDFITYNLAVKLKKNT